MDFIGCFRRNSYSHRYLLELVVISELCRQVALFTGNLSVVGYAVDMWFFCVMLLSVLEGLFRRILDFLWD